MDMHTLIDWGTRAVAICSVLYAVLPPYETFADFPRIQSAYKVLLAFIGGIAVNARSKVYPSISTNSGNTTSPAAESAPGGATGPK